MYKSIYKGGFFAYLALIILAIFFYKERIIYADSAFHLFFLIKNGTFEIQAARFGTILTQLLPLIFVKIGAPLKIVVMSYSLNYILNNFICYVLCGSVFKNYRYALILLLFNTMILSDTFYNIQSEIIQGMPMAIALLAYMSAKKTVDMKWYSYPLLFAGLATVAFIHPLAFFIVLFAVMYHLADKSSVADTKLFFISFGVFVLLVAIKHFFFSNGYDDQAEGSINNFATLFPHYFNNGATDKFIKYCIDKFYWMPILAAMNVIAYVVTRKWAKLILFVLLTFAYLMLVIVTHSDGNMTDAYAETMYMPLVFMVALPFTYDVLPLMNRYYLAYVVVAAIILLGLLRIYNTHVSYTNRLNCERALLDKYPHQKVLFAEGRVRMDDLVFSWSTSFEIWMLAVIEYHYSASILVSGKADQLAAEAQSGTRLFMTEWGAINYADLPKQYFNFKDTATMYSILK
ncbi:MAG: hypothetical protein BGO70_13575 [Bacteroidetes bacterium 43-93]|nr:hypothetical protein [Bacteroidota bacterium]OJW99465.1 MAG: hypothetical protein BGO70_13575 [Bacteroidetes bacterium 43-93]